MFNKKSKPAVWFLTILAVFFAVFPVSAVHNFDPFREEEKIVSVLQEYKQTDMNTRNQIDEILGEIKEEKAHWLICLWHDESGETGPKNRYPELYYLWLVDKLDLTLNILGEENELVISCVRPFIENLLDLVFTINRTAYFYHENNGWTASQIRRAMLGVEAF